MAHDMWRDIGEGRVQNERTKARSAKNSPEHRKRMATRQANKELFELSKEAGLYRT